jgi:hypothetical protein
MNNFDISKYDKMLHAASSTAASALEAAAQASALSHVVIDKTLFFRFGHRAASRL